MQTVGTQYEPIFVTPTIITDKLSEFNKFNIDALELDGPLSKSNFTQRNSNTSNKFLGMSSDETFLTPKSTISDWSDR